MNIRAGLISLLALCMVNVHAGDLYRSVDKNGKVQYGDMPPDNAAQVEKRKMRAASASDEDHLLPYESRMAKEKAPVTLYSSDDCGEGCKNARDLLNKRGIPFSEKGLNTQEAIIEFRAASGNTVVPTLLIGSKWLAGFQSEQWNNALDAAKYPKRAPLLRKPAPPAATK